MITTRSDIRRTLVTLLLAATTLLCGATQASATPPPQVEARSYILMDYNSSKVLAGSRADERMEPASLTKIMTVYVILQELKAGKFKLNDDVRISEKAWLMEGSRTFVEVGDRIPLEVLLKGLVVQSGNDATVALAEHVAGSEELFASLMNQTARALGMKGTNFVNSTGLPDPNHYTTAHDLALLTQAMIRNHPEHYAWYSLKEFTHNGITQHNRNKLLWMDAHVDGVKTGHTESAGYCLISSSRQDGMRLIAVVMGTSSENARAAESLKLLRYGFRFYETHRLYAPQKPLSNARVWKGETEQLPLGLTKELYLTLPRGQYGNLKATMKVSTKIMAPVEKGRRYGTLEVTLGGEKIATEPLVALQTIPEGGLFSRLIDDIKLLLE